MRVYLRPRKRALKPGASLLFSRKKILIHVNQIKLGMYVCELDRPWIGTPFLFQGFRINKHEEIVKLRSVCEYVYVDLERSLLLIAPDQVLYARISARMRSRYDLFGGLPDTIKDGWIDDIESLGEKLLKAKIVAFSSHGA